MTEQRARKQEQKQTKQRRKGMKDTRPPEKQIWRENS